MDSNGTAAGPRSRALSWVALGVVYVAWGLTYLAIRVGVEHLPPLLMAGIRYVVAGSLLYPIALRSARSSRGSAGGEARPGGAKPGVKAWVAGAVVGILLLFAGNGGVSVAETTLPSGIAAVLVATVPLWMIVFAWPLQHQRITVRAAAGLAVGLGGVAILVGGGTASGRMTGVLIVLAASAAWGFGSVLSHRLALPDNAMLAAAIEMLAGGAVLLAVAAGSGEFSRVQWSALPASSWIALAYLVDPARSSPSPPTATRCPTFPWTPSPPTRTSTPSSPCWPGSRFSASSSPGAKDLAQPSCSSRSSSPCAEATDPSPHQARRPAQFVIAGSRRKACVLPAAGAGQLILGIESNSVTFG